MKKFNAPWFEEMYLLKVENWIKDVLRDEGNLSLSGKLTEVKKTDFSLVLLVQVNTGNLYFKATRFSTHHEAAVSRYFHTMYPGKSTEIVRIQETEGWLLMKELGGVPIRQLKDKEIWKAALTEYAQLQVSEISNIDGLSSMNVPNRTLSTMKKEIIQHLEGMCDTGLSTEEKEAVMNLQPALIAMCDELEQLVPVHSIDHGDLHSANIQYVNGKLVFLDWGDSSITHPFFSTRVFWNSLYELVDNDSDWLKVIDEFRPHYLKAWTTIASMEKLEKALKISDQLACVHRAISWYSYLNPSVADQSEYKKPSQWLQALLEEREFAKAK
ncbi:phosphotransferase [Fictibacillus halophilus]|uniref:phosphotransferase n=1 Tax=Fictibacillus halophilus TaxID=1610490 RepID=UPI001CFBF9B5|nr:phosphotransferase [Fictibacillus halophilus]